MKRILQRCERILWLPVPCMTIIALLMAPFTIIGQSGDLDQIRNGPANDPSKNFYTTFSNPEWVNGNAGASNAHYVEGMSIAYRSLITGAQVGQSYEYVIEYDTKHSGRMAIDYLTHFQRLEPHGPFGHTGEVINPRIFKSGSKEYLLGTISTNTFPIPAPFQAPANTPVAGMPQNSFNALPAAETLMTIYNGTITAITYISQQSLTTSATESSTRVKIRFTAEKDSVVLAWGGHIASRLDWGFLNPSTPRSASGISGSPYHMRQISMNTYPGNVNIPGVGNQDRSLSAAAVIPPPECQISDAQLACPETSSLTFNYTGTTTGATFVWTVGPGNSAQAMISGSNTGSSVTIVPINADFVPGGTFDLTLAVTKQGITATCTRLPAATIQNVQVSATASPTTINLATGTTSQLNATATPAPNTLYNFSWTQDPATGGSLSATNIDNPVFTATAAGTYTFEVTATQIAAPFCSAKGTVVVTVASPSPPCEVSGPSPVCPGSTNTYCAPGPPPEHFTYTWSVEGDGSIVGATNGECVDVKADNKCGTYTVKLHIESENGLIKKDCQKVVSVEDNTAPEVVSCPSNQEFECSGTPQFGNPVFSDNCDNNLEVTYEDQRTPGCGNTFSITRTWTAKDDCGNTNTCSQTIAFVDKAPPVLTCPPDITVDCNSSTEPETTGTPTATDNCGSVEVKYTDAVTNKNCFRYIDRTWTAKDPCGNTSTCVQRIILVDRTAPQITCVSDIQVNCGDPIPDPVVTDDCSPNDITLLFKDVPGNASDCESNPYNLTRTWTAIDASGNISTCVQQITFISQTIIVRESSPASTGGKAVVTASPATAVTVAHPKPHGAFIGKALPATLQVHADPNPYSSMITFRFVSPKSGQATLVVYSFTGAKLAVVYNGKVTAGISYLVNYAVPLAKRVPVVYRLSIGDLSAQGKLLTLKK